MQNDQKDKPGNLILNAAGAARWDPSRWREICARARKNMPRIRKEREQELTKLHAKAELIGFEMRLPNASRTPAEPAKPLDGPMSAGEAQDVLDRMTARAQASFAAQCRRKAERWLSSIGLPIIRR